MPTYLPTNLNSSFPRRREPSEAKQRIAQKLGARLRGHDKTGNSALKEISRIT